MKDFFQVQAKSSSISLNLFNTLSFSIFISSNSVVSSGDPFYQKALQPTDEIYPAIGRKAVWMRLLVFTTTTFISSHWSRPPLYVTIKPLQKWLRRWRPMWHVLRAQERKSAALCMYGNESECERAVIISSLSAGSFVRWDEEVKNSGRRRTQQWKWSYNADCVWFFPCAPRSVE